MCHAFNRVFERVREVVHRVNAPLVAGVVVSDFADTVDDGVAHVHVRREHIDFRTQRCCAFVVFAARHLGKFFEIFFDGAIAPRRGFSRFVGDAAVVLPFFGGKMANVGLTELDQLDGVIVDFVEIVRGVEIVFAPIETEPAYVFLDGFDK